MVLTSKTQEQFILNPVDNTESQFKTFKIFQEFQDCKNPQSASVALCPMPRERW